MKTVGSLFSGIGGLDLGLERAGWTVVWQAETDKYASKVLKKHWPDVPNLGDVTQIDWSDVRRPDLVCGGFPCQPVSYAGSRKGDGDDRWLWPEVARCVRILRPRWVLLENVPGLLTLGFGQVAADLADLGYDFRWDCIPAAAVGAPHLRYRIFIVAHADRESEHDIAVDAEMAGAPQPLADTGSGRYREPGEALCTGRRTAIASGADVADTDESGRRGRPGEQWPGWWREPADGGWWESEPDLGRVAHGVPSRVDRLRCLGNAVVPQVAQLVAEMWLP